MSKLPHNRTWYSKKLVELAKRSAKLRDRYTCQMCGKDCVGSDAHGSHVEPVGAYKFLELDPLNIKCLCSYCHLRRWHKAPREWGKWFDDKFPTRAEYLDCAKRAKVKLTTVELAELYDRVRGNPEVYAEEYLKLITPKLYEKEAIWKT